MKKIIIIIINFILFIFIKIMLNNNIYNLLYMRLLRERSILLIFKFLMLFYRFYICKVRIIGHYRKSIGLCRTLLVAVRHPYYHI